MQNDGPSSLPPQQAATGGAMDWRSKLKKRNASGGTTIIPPAAAAETTAAAEIATTSSLSSSGELPPWMKLQLKKNNSSDGEQQVPPEKEVQAQPVAAAPPAAAAPWRSKVRAVPKTTDDDDTVVPDSSSSMPASPAQDNSSIGNDTSSRESSHKVESITTKTSSSIGTSSSEPTNHPDEATMAPAPTALATQKDTSQKELVDIASTAINQQALQGNQESGESAVEDNSSSSCATAAALPASEGPPVQEEQVVEQQQHVSSSRTNAGNNRIGHDDDNNNDGPPALGDDAALDTAKEPEKNEMTIQVTTGAAAAAPVEEQVEHGNDVNHDGRMQHDDVSNLDVNNLDRGHGKEEEQQHDANNVDCANGQDKQQQQQEADHDNKDEDVNAAPAQKEKEESAFSNDQSSDGVHTLTAETASRCEPNSLLENGQTANAPGDDGDDAVPIASTEIATNDTDIEQVQCGSVSNKDQNKEQDGDDNDDDGRTAQISEVHVTDEQPEEEDAVVIIARDEDENNLEEEVAQVEVVEVEEEEEEEIVDEVEYEEHVEQAEIDEAAADCRFTIPPFSGGDDQDGNGDTTEIEYDQSEAGGEGAEGDNEEAVVVDDDASVVYEYYEEEEGSATVEGDTNEPPLLDEDVDKDESSKVGGIIHESTSDALVSNEGTDQQEQKPGDDVASTNESQSQIVRDSIPSADNNTTSQDYTSKEEQANDIPPETAGKASDLEVAVLPGDNDGRTQQNDDQNANPSHILQTDQEADHEDRVLDGDSKASENVPVQQTSEDSESNGGHCADSFSQPQMDQQAVAPGLRMDYSESSGDNHGESCIEQHLHQTVQKAAIQAQGSYDPESSGDKQRQSDQKETPRTQGSEDCDSSGDGRGDYFVHPQHQTDKEASIQGQRVNDSESNEDSCGECFMQEHSDQKAAAKSLDGFETSEESAVQEEMDRKVPAPFDEIICKHEPKKSGYAVALSAKNIVHDEDIPFDEIPDCMIMREVDATIEPSLMHSVEPMVSPSPDDVMAQTSNAAVKDVVEAPVRTSDETYITSYDDISEYDIPFDEISIGQPAAPPPKSCVAPESVIEPQKEPPPSADEPYEVERADDIAAQWSPGSSIEASEMESVIRPPIEDNAEIADGNTSSDAPGGNSAHIDAPVDDDNMTESPGKDTDDNQKDSNETEPKESNELPEHENQPAVDSNEIELQGADEPLEYDEYDMVTIEIENQELEAESGIEADSNTIGWQQVETETENADEQAGTRSANKNASSYGVSADVIKTGQRPLEQSHVDSLDNNNGDITPDNERLKDDPADELRAESLSKTESDYDEKHSDGEANPTDTENGRGDELVEHPANDENDLGGTCADAETSTDGELPQTNSTADGDIEGTITKSDATDPICDANPVVGSPAASSLEKETVERAEGIQQPAMSTNETAATIMDDTVASPVNDICEDEEVADRYAKQEQVEDVAEGADNDRTRSSHDDHTDPKAVTEANPLPAVDEQAPAIDTVPAITNESPVDDVNPHGARDEQQKANTIKDAIVTETDDSLALPPSTLTLDPDGNSVPISSDINQGESHVGNDSLRFNFDVGDLVSAGPVESKTDDSTEPAPKDKSVGVGSIAKLFGGSSSSIAGKRFGGSTSSIGGPSQWSSNSRLNNDIGKRFGGSSSSLGGPNQWSNSRLNNDFSFRGGKSTKRPALKSCFTRSMADMDYVHGEHSSKPTTKSKAPRRKSLTSSTAKSPRPKRPQRRVGLAVNANGDLVEVPMPDQKAKEKDTTTEAPTPEKTMASTDPSPPTSTGGSAAWSSRAKAMASDTPEAGKKFTMSKNTARPAPPLKPSEPADKPESKTVVKGRFVPQRSVVSSNTGATESSSSSSKTSSGMVKRWTPPQSKSTNSLAAGNRGDGNISPPSLKPKETSSAAPPPTSSSTSSNNTSGGMVKRWTPPQSKSTNFLAGETRSCVEGGALPSPSPKPTETSSSAPPSSSSSSSSSSKTTNGGVAKRWTPPQPKTSTNGGIPPPLLKPKDASTSNASPPPWATRQLKKANVTASGPK